MMTMEFLIQGSYFVAAMLCILGLKQMSSPVTARRGIVWAGAGMVLATLVTFAVPEVIDSEHAVTNIVLIIVAIAIGGGYAWVTAKKVAMTDMPQMIAMYNGMGGGAAATIAAAEAAIRSFFMSSSPTFLWSRAVDVGFPNSRRLPTRGVRC